MGNTTPTQIKIMENYITFNLKPSHRIHAQFKLFCGDDNIYYIGRMNLGSKRISYRIKSEFYEENKVKLRQFGSKSRK